MSGKRQHFIPRFLQVPFASHSVGVNYFAWVFRKGSAPFNTNITNVGVEGHFYSVAGNTTVDERITEFETHASELCNALRSGSAAALRETSSIAELLAHLEIRTRHIRSLWLSTGSALVNQLLQALEDPVVFVAFVRKYFEEDPGRMRLMIADELRNKRTPDSLVPRLVKASEPIIAAYLSEPIPGSDRFIAGIRSVVASGLVAGAKQGHLKALTQNLAPPAKSRNYSELELQLIDSPGVTLPLGDSVLIFEVNESGCYRSVHDSGDKLLRVYLPLSPSSALVAHANAPLATMDHLPLAIAQCSLKYFISNARSAANEAHQARLGERAHLVSQEQINAILAECFGKILGG